MIMDKISKGWLHWIVMGVMTLLYLFAHVSDCIFTIDGLLRGAVPEANPVVRWYMVIFGVKRGLIICKTVMTGFIIFGAIIISLAYKQRGKDRHRVRAIGILFVGFLLTFLGGSLWLKF